MLNIQKFVCNMFAENTYVVSDSTKDCVIVDCGALYPEELTAIKDYIRRNELKPVHLICTHGHLDHVFGNGFVYREYGLKAEIHADDEALIAQIPQQALSMIGMVYDDEQAPVGRFLRERDVIDFGNHQLRLIHTPGHTKGGAVFYCEDEKVAFTGDTLFNMSIGRTDFEGGSFTDLMESLKKLRQQLPPETTLYCGHGNQTTMAYECQWNPYMK